MHVGPSHGSNYQVALFNKQELVCLNFCARVYLYHRSYVELEMSNAILADQTMPKIQEMVKTCNQHSIPLLRQQQIVFHIFSRQTYANWQILCINHRNTLFLMLPYPDTLEKLCKNIFSWHIHFVPVQNSTHEKKT